MNWEAEKEVRKRIVLQSIEGFTFSVDKVIVKLSNDAFNKFDVCFPPFASDKDVEDMKKQLECKLPNSSITFKKLNV